MRRSNNDRSIRQANYHEISVENQLQINHKNVRDAITKLLSVYTHTLKYYYATFLRIRHAFNLNDSKFS